MMKHSPFTALAGAAALIAPASALAQWTPGSEIVGQPLEVTTNGVTNTIVLNPGGQAQITTPGGNVVPATWSAANGQLCLSTGTAQECWSYTSAFQPGQPMTLTSSCGSSSWLAGSTNMPPPPPQSPGGERG